MLPIGFTTVVQQKNGYERLETLDGQYIVQRFVHGDDFEPCEPYYCAYQKYNGKRIHDGKLADLKEAAILILAHRNYNASV